MTPVTSAPARRIYRAAPGAGFNDEQAARYARFLEREVGLGRRIVPPEDIVDAARPATSPLHERFTWDDAVAAEHWRLEQARHLVGHIVVTASAPDDGRVQRRAFLNVRAESDEGPTRGYTSERLVWKSPQLAGQVVEQALTELRGWRDRYRTYAELGHITAVVDEVLAEEGEA